MKVAIVGTTAILSENEERHAREHISLILKSCPTGTLIISGGAKGVDTIAIEIAHDLGYPTKIYKPEIEEWTPPNGKIGYKKRNLQIAKECEELYCFAVSLRKEKCYHHEIPQYHEKTAGCYTAQKAGELGKSTMLIVLPSS